MVPGVRATCHSTTSRLNIWRYVLETPVRFFSGAADGGTASEAETEMLDPDEDEDPYASVAPERIKKGMETKD